MSSGSTIRTMKDDLEESVNAQENDKIKIAPKTKELEREVVEIVPQNRQFEKKDREQKENVTVSDAAAILNTNQMDDAQKIEKVAKSDELNNKNISSKDGVKAEAEGGNIDDLKELINRISRPAAPQKETSQGSIVDVVSKENSTILAKTSQGKLDNKKAIAKEENGSPEKEGDESFSKLTAAIGSDEQSKPKVPNEEGTIELPKVENKQKALESSGKSKKHFWSHLFGKLKSNKREDITSDNQKLLDSMKKQKENGVKKNISKPDKDELIKKVLENQKLSEENTKGGSTDDLKSLISRMSKPSVSAKENVVGNVVKENGVPLEEFIDAIHSNEQSEEETIKKNEISRSLEKENQKIILNGDEESKKYLWSDISEKLKNNTRENKTEKTEKTDDSEEQPLSKEQKIIKKDSLRSGILNRAENGEKKKDDLSDKQHSFNAYNKDYVPPNERLIHGKQELYSSVSKKIKQRDDKDNLDALKESERTRNEQENIISKDEEYKKLKKGIIQKYHIKLFSLPWLKIVVVGVIFIVSVGVITVYIFPKDENPPVIVSPAIAVGSEIEKFSDINDRIVKESSSFGFGGPEEDAKRIFASNDGIKVIKLEIVDNKTDNNMLTLEDALKIILNKDSDSFQEGFLEATNGKYNILIFESNSNSIRYGLAIETNENSSIYNIMKKWEADQTIERRMISVFKNLFIDDENKEYLYKEFSSIYDNLIEVNYSHLVDQNTALNYFIYDNIVVITTSKDSNNIMINLVLSN